MSTTAQVLANRQNSLLSTGPRSDAGKIASAKNAISHGLSSTGDPVLPHEDPAQFATLLQKYKLDFSPATAHEEFLVVSMVGARWRLERAGRIENAIFEQMFDSPEDQMAQTQMTQAMMSKEGDAVLRLERYRAGIERTYHRCHRELQAAKKFNADAYTTQLTEKKFDNLLTNYINAPFPRPANTRVQNEPNSAPTVRPHPQPFVHSTPKIGRNDFCSCGSGLKDKKCCLEKSNAKSPAALQSAA
jgi:uncharacterized protein YecA (UPF0149 family)